MRDWRNFERAHEAHLKQFFFFATLSIFFYEELEKRLVIRQS